MDFKSYFDIPKDLLYFNTPGNGLMPKTNYAWREQRDRDFFNPQDPLREQQGDFIEQVRSKIASFFFTDVHSVFCVPNFSFGFNTLLSGIPSSIPMIIVEGDYPSVNYPVFSRGFSAKTVALDENLEANIEKSILPNTEQILFLSIVQYISGVKIDLSFIQELKHKYPKLLIIGDATQFLGTEKFDFQHAGFDGIGASGYKWLLSGFGNGFMLLNERLRALIYQEAQQKSLPQETMWAGRSILKTYFEPGHIDTLAHGTLLQSLNFLETANLDLIQKHIQGLTEIAYSELNKRDLLLPIAKKRKIQSSLVNIQLNPNLYPKLVESGIRCFPRGSGIRIGIHLYNTEEDLNRLLKIIDQI
ncbi:aminotransferase class V-fold PLP-dependent enzyme [Sphingobacterium hungaricum]|uniref:Aminotransferase V n=1 Tax=Sphingobacterium hungaricum TaxID=2082723 RepID=A0A928UZ54_9SPHI|nr:aminotransferase class V-fold PLP-dependent enzyme [Sphingobacterium hungaricum]MBE8713492.1 aminotransferase V [Sphingobacterium hungaricum]